MYVHSYFKVVIRQKMMFFLILWLKKLRHIQVEKLRQSA